MNTDDILNKFLAEQEEQKKPKAMPPVGDAEQDTSTDGILNRFLSEQKVKAVADMPEPETDSNIFAEEGTLKKADLKKGMNAKTIRSYMIDRHGDDYRFGGKIDDDKLVEDFFDHMRSFNTNVMSTAMEVRFVSNAKDSAKENANAAFQLYDRTGNVFTNDGLFGAIDGVTDYMKAAALDPTNYIGVLTGGLAKWAGMGVTQGSKAAVRQAIKEAGKKAIIDPKNMTAVMKTQSEATSRILGHMASKSVQSETAKKTAVEAAKQEALIFRKELVKKAMREKQGEFIKQGARKTVLGTTAIDGTLAALNDYQIQGVYEEINPQYQYNVTQTAFSSLFGTIAGGAQLLGQSFKGASGLADATDGIKLGAMREEVMAKVDKVVAKEGRILDEPLQKAASENILKNVKSWAEKIKGKPNFFERNNESADIDLLKDIVLGSNRDGKGDGIVAFYKKAEAAGSVARIGKNTRVSDVLTNVLEAMPEKDIIEMNNALKQTGIGIKIGDLGSIPDALRDLLAKDASDAGKTLQVWSQARRMIDGTVLRADDVLADAAVGVTAREAEKASKMKPLQYGQNLWKRMLVSSVSTSAVNVAGFTQYFVASSLSDLLSGGAFMAAGIVTPGKKGLEMRKLGKVYMNSIVEKARHLMDPYTTHDTYMKFLSENKDLSKVLFETVSGGVERTAQRYGIDDTKPWYKVSEAVANGASKLTGVRIQDSFTKSQMFMTEMDKYARIKHGMSLRDILKQGKTDLLDDEVMGSALDGTMKSVFSKDYTVQDNLLSGTAKWVEDISALPVIGTVLPFGRFMNNVVATSYQWSVGGLVDVMSAVVMSSKRNLDTVEAASRSIVGLTALGLAMQYDRKNYEDGRGFNEIDTGGGTYVDVKNVFPASLWLAAGRALNYVQDGQTVPEGLKKDLGAQIAIAQAASDAEFGRDIYAIMDLFLNKDADRGAEAVNALYQKTGSILAGFTRPLAALNDMAGYINNTDAARDPRQAEGLTRTSLEATKYMDNLVEMVTDKLDGVTGEELRVALREGSVRDPAPMSKALGVKVVPARTSGEIVFNTAGIHPYMLNSRTKVPEYDKLYAELIAPIIERKAEVLLTDPKWINGSKDEQVKMANKLKAEAKKELNTLLEIQPNEQQHVIKRKKLMTQGDPIVRKMAKEEMAKRGVEGPMSEWTMRQLMEYENLIKLVEEYR